MAPNTQIDHQADRRGDQRQVASITLVACLMYLVFVFVDRGWGPIITPLSTQLHISLAAAGLLYVAWSIGYLPGVLIGGTMLDRYGPRLVFFVAAITILTGITSIYLGLLLHVASLLVLVIMAGFAGIGGGIMDAVPTGLISHLFAQRRGTALNVFNTLYPVGGVVIGLIDAGLLTLFHNDPLPPFIFTICFILVALLVLPAMPREYRVEVKTTHHDQDAPRQSIMSLLVTLVPVIAIIALTGINASLGTSTPAYLHVAYGQTAAIAAALGSLAWAFSIFSRLGAALLVVRIGAWGVLMLGVAIALCGLVMLLLSPTALLGTLAIGLTSIGLSPIFSCCLTIGSERAGRSPGTVAGIVEFTNGITTVFYGWLFGFLLNARGPAWAVIFSLVLVCGGGLVALRLRPR